MLLHFILHWPQVSRFCLGCMSFGNPDWNGWAKGEEKSLPLIKMAYDAGINFFDTADVYSFGESEKLLGKAIKKYNMDRSRIIIASKVIGVDIVLARTYHLPFFFFLQICEGFSPLFLS